MCPGLGTVQPTLSIIDGLVRADVYYGPSFWRLKGSRSGETTKGLSLGAAEWMLLGSG